MVENENTLVPGSGRTNNGNNLPVALACVMAVAMMGGLAYASVPLYALFCQVTGFAGTVQRAEQAPLSATGRPIAVRFDANVTGGLAWDFQPVKRQVTVALGKKIKIDYRAVNRSKVKVTASATFNVTPLQAGAYFNKIECFCFTETTLEPGQTLNMPVVFFVDPELADDPDIGELSAITLSYSMFEVETEKVDVSTVLESAGAISNEDNQL